MADRKLSASTELAVEPAVGDLFLVLDISDATDAATGTIKKFLWSTLKAIFAVAAKGVTGGDSHDHAGGDGAQIDHGGLAGLSDDDHTQYVKHSLATAASDFLAASGAGVFVKKTLAEVKTILSLAALAYKATVGTSDIDVEAVTYARMQHVSATDKVLGRSTAGAGDVEEIACTAAGRAILDDANAAAQLATLSAAPTASPTFTGTVTLPNTIEFQDTSADHQYVLSVSELTANRTINLPLLTAADVFVFAAFIQTLTNKRITPRVGTVGSSATPTPASDDVDFYTVTALAEAATFGAPTGTPTQGQKLTIRIKDNATARALGWNAIYRALGVALPTTTTISKTLYVGFIYNSTDTKWDCVAKTEEA